MRRLSNHVYECLEKCGYKLIAAGDRDGMSCADCGAPMNPIGYAKPGEMAGWSRTPKKKVYIDARLSYLDRLIDIYKANTNPSLANTIDRIAKVCNSIEKDLGLSEPFKVGDLKTNITVNADVLVEAIKKVEEIKRAKAGGFIKPSEEDAVCPRCFAPEGTAHWKYCLKLPNSYGLTTHNGDE